MISRIDWATSSFKPSQALYTALHEIITESPALDQIYSVTAGSAAFGMQPISSNVIEQGRIRGGNPLGLSAEAQTWYVVDSGWWFDEDEATVHAALRQAVDAIDKAAGDNYVPYIFMNDASWDQDVIAHYGAENVGKLKEIQDKYDPDQVFQKLVPGGFKLHSVN